MKILNLYAGIGGNRKLWGNEHEITAVEIESYIADVYRGFYPSDTVIVGDAHQYLLDHFREFDFIWSSPPCPSHSRVSSASSGWGIYRYPDMKLYEEIIFLKHFYKGKYVVENVIPYYTPLISANVEIDRHLFWSNFNIERISITRGFDVIAATAERLSKHHGISIPDHVKDKRKLLRNCVTPDIGLAILINAIGSYNQGNAIQTGLFAELK